MKFRRVMYASLAAFALVPAASAAAQAPAGKPFQATSFRLTYNRRDILPSRKARWLARRLPIIGSLASWVLAAWELCMPPRTSV